MLFSVKNQLFVFATLHHSPSGFASVANVAAIGRPKMAYPSVILFYKSLNEFDYFFVIWQLICMPTFVLQEIKMLPLSNYWGAG